MKNYTMVFVVLILFTTCAKNKETKVDNNSNDDEYQDYYQKNLRFDGLKGEVDSIISNVYEAEGLSKGELVSRDIKRFNPEGYIVSHETRAYEGDELFSAGQTLYTRDSNSLENEQLNNFISKSGAGYTLQYTLADRGLNRETWELIRKVPERDLELLAEVREFSKNGMKIFTQVGNTDSTTLKYEYRYLDNGLDSSILFYNNGIVRQEIQKNFSAEGSPIELITLYRDINGEVDFKKVETFEYTYDEYHNPIFIKIYDENILMGIIENTIFYRNKK